MGQYGCEYPTNEALALQLGEVSKVIISMVPYCLIQKGIAKCPIKHALLIAALHIRNIALQQKIWSVLAVK
jgi:hypothetical protein